MTGCNLSVNPLYAWRMKLWHENRIDHEYEAPDEMIVKGYAEWAPSHPSSRPTAMHVAIFVASKDGMNSVAVPADLNELLNRHWTTLNDARFAEA